MCPSHWRASRSGQQSRPRHHRNRVPGGTSKARRQAGVNWGPCVSGHLRCGTIGTEVRALDSHAMQDDTDTARQRDHRTLRSSAAGNLSGPCPEPGRTATVHHDCGGLAQSASKVDVAGLGDATRDITLARLVSRGRQSNPRPDLLRGRETSRVIHRGSIGQCDHRTDPGH